MGGGSTSQFCPNCGAERRADARFCRACGRDFVSKAAEPVPFPDLPAMPAGSRGEAPATAPGTVPLNLPAGGVAPAAWSGEDTVTAAVPAAAATGPSGWAPPPAEHQATRYPPPDEQATRYQAADQDAVRYPPPDQQATRYQPADSPPAGYQAPGHQSPDYGSAEYQPPGYPPPGRGPRGDGGSRRRIIVGGLAVIVAVAGIAAGLVIARAHAHSGNQAAPGQSTPPGSSGSTAGGSPGSVPPTSGAPSSAAAPTEQQGATNLAALLAQSGSDRGAINSAYNDVMSCGPTLAQDQGTFQQAAASRKNLLSQLASLPDAAALPAAMISSLTQAWQASITADQDYAAWAGDEAASCTPNGSDSHLAAANIPDNQATTNKTAFVNAWNPIATKYQLQTYAQDQI
jgi:zinc-ribbon domain